MLKIPRRQYAISSVLVVFLCEIQDIFSAAKMSRSWSIGGAVHCRISRRMSDSRYCLQEINFSASKFLGRIIESYFLRSNELLKCPASSEPSALRKACIRLYRWVEIKEKYITDNSIRIISEHGVDGLGQLGAAALIDTTCVHPDVIDVVLHRLLTGYPDFGEAAFAELIKPSLHILK